MGQFYKRLKGERDLAIDSNQSNAAGIDVPDTEMMY